LPVAEGIAFDARLRCVKSIPQTLSHNLVLTPAGRAAKLREIQDGAEEAGDRQRLVD